MTLIDTSAWVEALRRDGDEGVRSRVEGLLKAGHAILCDIVNLYERSKLRQITETLDRVPTTDAVWTMANNLATACRTQARDISSAEISKQGESEK